METKKKMHFLAFLDIFFMKDIYFLKFIHIKFYKDYTYTHM